MTTLYFQDVCHLGIRFRNILAPFSISQCPRKYCRSNRPPTLKCISKMVTMVATLDLESANILAHFRSLVAPISQSQYFGLNSTIVENIFSRWLLLRSDSICDQNYLSYFTSTSRTMPQ